MATKKSSSKGAAKKSSKKTSAKKTSAKKAVGRKLPPPPPPPTPTTCFEKCIRNYQRCLNAGTNPLVCRRNLARCLLICARVSIDDLSTVLK